MKRIVQNTLIVASILALLVMPPNTQAQSIEEVTYTDVPETHWAYEDIMSGASRGYINGLPDGSFAPDANVKRSEFIKMTVAALGLEIDSDNDDPWYVPFIESAIEHSLILDSEYADKNYNANMTRMEIVRIAVKAVNEEARNTEIINEELMLMATQSGIIRGINGKLDPHAADAAPSDDENRGRAV